MDLRSPFVVPVSDLSKRPGSEREFDAQLPAPADAGVQLIGVPEGEEMDLSLGFQTVSEGVFVQGSVRTRAVGECSRCLRGIDLDVNEHVAELVFWPERQKALVDEGDEEAAELPVVVDDHIDLEPIIRDAIVLSLPFTPVCEPGCAGLCAECGERWENLPDDHKHEKFNPAFSALDALAAQLAAEEGGARAER